MCKVCTRHTYLSVAKAHPAKCNFMTVLQGVRASASYTSLLNGDGSGGGGGGGSEKLYLNGWNAIYTNLLHACLTLAQSWQDKAFCWIPLVLKLTPQRMQEVSPLPEHLETS